MSDGARHDGVEWLFRDHAPAILGYLARRVDPVDAAADLMSEVMLTAWRRRAVIPDPPEDVLWLYGVARHVLANHRRSTRRRSAATEALARKLRTRPQDARQPSAEILDMRAALAMLDEADRELLTLTFWEGLSSAEISVVVGLPASTVRTRVGRARETVRTLLTAATVAS